MSASIDNGSDSAEEDSRHILSTWLDEYIAGRCDRAKMHESFLEVCRRNPEAPWDALALLDQYQRRGRVDIALARSLKAEIAQLVFGVATQTEESPDTEATLDTSGSRWRKLYAERGSLNADEASVEDPALRRDFEPITRPPPIARARKPSPPAADSATAPAGGDVEIGIGTLLRDRYELMDIIGSDATGTIYQAFDRHRSHLPSPSCHVAVRVLQLPLEGRGVALAAIEREAYEAQSLSHPNIVSVFDLDRHQDIYFVVMELLEGERLSDVMRRLAGKPMSRERALAVVGAVGAALLHAHQRNIAHGDLKPNAIVLTTGGDVKVLEFGFARSHALDQWLGSEPSVEGTDASSTSAYATVERVNAEEPHPRDDVYSLACIAYEMLTGRHPFGGRSAALAQAQGRAPQKISGLSLRQWQVLQNALNWSRNERRVDVGELLASLGSAEPRPRMLAAPAAGYSLENPFGGGKGVLLAVLVVVVAGALAWWQLPRLIEPSRVSPIATPAEIDPERTGPAATTPAPEAAVPPPVEAKPLPAPTAEREELTTPTPASGIVAATADPPTPTATASSAPTTAQQSPSADMQREEAPRNASRAISIEFDKDTYVATESDAMVRLTVRRNGSTRGVARFRWMLRANSAEAGSDYAGIGPGMEEIPAGSRTMTLTIPLVSDVVPENTELFLVELEPLDAGPAIGEQAHAAVILVDDD